MGKSRSRIAPFLIAVLPMLVAALPAPAVPSPPEPDWTPGAAPDTVLPPDTAGRRPWIGLVEGLVNPANGQLLLPQDDIALRSVGHDRLQHAVPAYRDDPLPPTFVNLRLTYHSGASAADGPFGHGWSHAYGASLEELPGGDVVFRDMEGTPILFLLSPPGYAVAEGPDAFLLEKAGDGSFTLDTKVGLSYRFDALGRLAAIRDPSDRALAVARDGSGRVARVEGVHGIYLDFAYGSDGRVSRVTDSLGRATDYAYDASGDLVRVTDALGGDRLYRYEGHDLVAAIGRGGIGLAVAYTAGVVTELGAFLHHFDSGLDSQVLRTHTLFYGDGNVVVHGPRGGQTRIQMDAHGSAVKVVDALGGTTRYAYDEDHNLVRFQDAAGSVYVYEYDAKGNLVAVTDALGSTLTRTWADAGRPPHSVLASVTNRRGVTFTFAHDAAGRTTGMTTPAGSYAFTYDAEGNLRSLVDTRGSATLFDYDFGSRLLSETDALGRTRFYEYDGAGRLLREVDPRGGVTSYEYDARDNLVHRNDALGGSWTYTYTPEGSLETTTDPLGRTTAMAHNLLGRQTGTTDALGGAESWVYDAAGNVVRTTDVEGAGSFSYQYDLLDRVTEITDPLGNVVRYTYDRVGNRLSRTDALGTTRYAYDALGQMVRRTDALGQEERFDFDAEGNVIRETAKDGSVTLRTYDALNRLVSERRPSGGAFVYAYDGEGHLLRLTDARGGVVTHEHDAAGQLVAATDPLGSRRTIAYDPAGNVASTTDARGATTTYDHDLLNRLVRREDALGGVRTYTYTATGRLRTETDERGGVTTRRYDDLDRVIAVTDPLGLVTAYAYDAFGNTLSMTDGAGGVHAYTYDALNRLTSETTPAGRVTAYTYDAAGNRLSRTDGNGHTTAYAYDALGRLVRETNPLGAVTAYSYDALNRLASVTDANGGTTTFTRTPEGWLTSVRSPLGNTMAYRHDAMGNVIQRTDPDGRVTRYTYDALNRLTRTAYAGGGSVSLQYDPEGNLLREATVGHGPGTTAAYAYDLLGRRTSAQRSWVTGPAPGMTRTSSYAYDAVGNRVQIRYPDGTLLLQTHDLDRRPTAISEAGAGTFTFAYDGAGRRTRLTYGNGASASYAYDADGQMTEVVHRDAAMAVISFDRHTYDAAGNRLTREDASGTTTYAYDAANRLVSEDPPGAAPTTWTYDAVGNRLTESGPGGAETYLYDADHRLLSGGGALYTYDRSGNRASRSDASGTTVYSYDFENRLTRVALPDKASVEYRYAGDGTRIERTSGGGPSGTTRYTHLGHEVLEEWSAAGVSARYVLGPHVDEPLAARRGAYTYYLANTQGSVTRLLDAAGATVHVYAYDAFGNLRSEAGSSPNPYLFTARDYDRATGLVYLRARWYDPGPGRFLTKDPLESLHPLARELHPYLFVNNNPVNRVDPTGYSGHTIKGTMLNGKEYWFDEYDEASVRAAQALLDAAHDRNRTEADALNKLHLAMLDAKHKMEQARDKAWYSFGFKLAGVAVGIIGLFSGNPFLTYLGISLFLHETAFDIANGESALDVGTGTAKTALGETLDKLKDNPDVRKALKKVAEGVKVLGVIADAVGAINKAMEALDHGKALAEARKLNDLHRQNVATGVYDRTFQATLEAARAAATALAEADRKTGEPVPTPGGGRGGPRGPQEGEPTPTEGGGSTGGIVAPDGGFVDVPPEIDPFSSVPIPIGVKNFGRTDLVNASVKVRVYPEPAARRVLLVVDESDGAHAWFEEALTDIGVPYDIVFVDTEYTPRYVDGDPLTKDLKDYDTVLWETSNDAVGTLAPPAQPELATYLDFGGCLFLGGDGFMKEWPAPEGTLMSDWMFADGYGGDSLDFQVHGVPGTIGAGLDPVLAGGTGSDLHALGATLSGVKPPGEPAFLYNKSLAAIQGENATANGTYKTVLASFEFASISARLLRDVLMERIIEYLTCQPVAEGDTPVPTLPSTWETPGASTTVTTTVTLEPGRYVAVVTLHGGGDTYTPNNVARIPVTVKPPNVIDSCGEISEPGNYTITADLVSPGDCLLVTADDVFIDGDGHSITYGTGGPGTGVTIVDGDGDGVRNVGLADVRVQAGGGGTTGLFLQDGVEGIQIRDNRFLGGDRGLLVVNAAGTIEGNIVQGNAVGMFVQGVPPGTLLVFDNLFVNGQNAVDPIGLTRWNLPAPDCSEPNIIGGLCRGGNAWHDYAGVDLDGDGIGDTDIPYTSGGAISGDFLPLTNDGP